MSDDPQSPPPPPALDPEAQFQLIDGPSEHQGIHQPAALRELATSGRIPLHARLLKLDTMATSSVGELLGIGDDAVVASAGPTPTSAPEAAGGQQIILGERSAGDAAIERFAATLQAEGKPVTALVLGEKVSRPARQHFEQIHRQLQGLKHENLVAVRCVEEHATRLVVALGPLDGRLFSELMIGSPPSLDLVASWSNQIAAGLWAAAKKGIHHLALGPDLIQVDRGDHSARVWGFGLGGVLQASPAQAARSLPYRPPEILRGERGDHRSDIYALAAIIYHLLSGRPPHAGQDPSSLLQAIEAGAPESLSERDRRIPDSLDLALRSALSVDPQHRPQSSAAFARELRDAVAEASSASGGQRRSSSSGGQRRRSSSSGGHRRGSSSSLEPIRRSPSSSGHASTVSAVTTPTGSSPAAKLLGLLVLAALGAGGWFGWQHLQQSDRPLPAAPETQTSDTRPVIRPVQEHAADTGAASEADPADALDDPSLGSDIEVLAAWQDAEDRQRWAEAHRYALAFATRFPSRMGAVRLRMPLLITPSPAEARVVIDGVESGNGDVIHRYPPGTDAMILVHAPGHQPMVRRLREFHGVASWSPELQALPALRWLQVLASEATAGPAPMDQTGRVVVPCERGLAILSLVDGSQLQVTLEGSGPHALGPVLRYRETSFLIGDHRLFAIDNRRAMVRWSFPPIDVPGPGFRLGGCAGPHELIPEQGKLWVIGTDHTLRCFASRERQGSELSPTPLPAAPSAPPAMVMIDNAMSAVAVPVGRRLVVFDGATVSPTSAAQELFRHDLGAPITHAPLAFRYRDRPWLLVADNHQRLLAIDPRPGVDQRYVAEWQLPHAPATAPLRLGQDGRCMIGLITGQVVAIDLDRPGQLLWASAGEYPLTGPPVASGELVLSTHQDGSLLGTDASNGTLRFLHQLGITPLGSPVADGERALVVGAEGVVLGLGLGR